MEEVRPDNGVFHDDSFCVRDADERTELRVAALNQLREARRRQTRGDGARFCRAKLTDEPTERAPLRDVVLPHIHDERGRSGIVDEVVADGLRLPRIAVGLVLSEAGAEDRFRQ